MANEIYDDDDDDDYYYFDDGAYAHNTLHDDFTMTPELSSLNVSAPSTFEYDTDDEHEMSFITTVDDTKLLIAKNTDQGDCTEEEQQQQQQITSDQSEEWFTSAASIPLPTTTPPTDNCHRVEREIENELFQKIENLVREFLTGPNRQYPYYRVIRLNTDEQTNLEYILTIVINRPTVIFSK